MKKIIASLLFTLGLIGLYEAIRIIQLAYLNPKDGAGIGISIIGGLIELNDKVLYADVLKYLFPILLLGISFMIGAIFLFKQNHTSNKRKEGEYGGAFGPLKSL